MWTILIRFDWGLRFKALLHWLHFSNPKAPSIFYHVSDPTVITFQSCKTPQSFIICCAVFGVCSAFTFVDLWHKRDFLDQVPYLTGTWGNTLPPVLGPLHCFNTAPNACLVFSDLRVNSTFLTSACDIVQICLSHTPYLGRGSGLSSVTFVFVIRRTVDPRLQKSHAHTQIHITGPVFAYTPQSSPAFITTQDKHCDNKGLVWLSFRIACLDS